MRNAWRVNVCVLKNIPHVEFQQSIKDNRIPRLDIAMTCLARYAASLRPAEECKCMMASTVEKVSSCVCEDSNGLSSTRSFPMFTLPSLAFMKMSRVQPHEDLMETCSGFKEKAWTFELQTLWIMIARNLGFMKNLLLVCHFSFGVPGIPFRSCWLLNLS